MAHITQIKPGAPLPAGEPKRYPRQSGYVVLRWRVAPGELVECYEHRAVMGNPPAGFDVHHKNGIRDDNRPENLQIVTPEEHGREHSTFCVPMAVKLYEWGFNQTELARIYGVDSSNICRALDGLVEARPPIADAQVADPEAVRLLYEKKRWGVRAISHALGTCCLAVDRALDEAGVERRGPGRVSGGL